MDQCAIFVDAGYFFAQGAKAIVGHEVARGNISVTVEKIAENLISLQKDVAPHARLLRIYWYDGLQPRGGLTSAQSVIASYPNIKMRFGQINSMGEQKGVDSLIITDLIELARLKSISDAILVSGDEDLRVGVQIAQNHGVRVHLLGISAKIHSGEHSGTNQSPTLTQEADRIIVWGDDLLNACLCINKAEPNQKQLSQSKAMPNDEGLFAQLVSQCVQSLNETQLSALTNESVKAGTIPPDIDRPLLARAKTVNGGENLSPQEKRALRDMFWQQVERRLKHS